MEGLKGHSCSPHKKGSGEAQCRRPCVTMQTCGCLDVWMDAKYSGVSGIQHTLLLPAPEDTDIPSGDRFSVSVVSKKTKVVFGPLTKFFQEKQHTLWSEPLERLKCQGT